MTDPYAGPRAAVAAYALTAVRGGSAVSAPAPESVHTADPGVGVYQPLRSSLVATYPATGYPRWLESVSMKCTFPGPVNIYIGSMDDLGFISSFGDGSRSEYEPFRPKFVPAGAPVFVAWYVPNGNHTSTCRMQLSEVV